MRIVYIRLNYMEKNMTCTAKKSKNIRFEKESKALKKNLQKRKKQEEDLNKLKNLKKEENVSKE